MRLRPFLASAMQFQPRSSSLQGHKMQFMPLTALIHFKFLIVGIDTGNGPRIAWRENEEENVGELR